MHIGENAPQAVVAVGVVVGRSSIGTVEQVMRIELERFLGEVYEKAVVAVTEKEKRIETAVMLRSSLRRDDALEEVGCSIHIVATVVDHRHAEQRVGAFRVNGYCLACRCKSGSIVFKPKLAKA